LAGGGFILLGKIDVAVFIYFVVYLFYTKATLNFGFWKWKNAINYGENKKWKPIFKATTVYFKIRFLFSLRKFQHTKFSELDKIT
jgi:hypothetical protein